MESDSTYFGGKFQFMSHDDASEILLEETIEERQITMTRRSGPIPVAAHGDHAHGGQHYGLVIALVFGGLAIWATLAGHPWFGGIMGGGVLFSLVVVFVTGKVVKPALPKGWQGGEPRPALPDSQ